MRSLIRKAGSLSLGDFQQYLPHVLAVLLVATTTLILRADRGIRAFPSVDDYAYLPLARRFLNGELFPDDVFVTTSILHAPAWSVVIWLSEKTIGVAYGFYAMVLLLSFFTILAVWRLLRILGGSGALLPAAAMLAFANRVPGLGRGLHDGVFGAGFHTQWLALCLMLWVYTAWLQQKPLRTGVLLGLCVAAHPVVGVHAVVVLGIATVVALVDFTTLVVIMFVAGLIAAPVVVPVMMVLVRAPQTVAWPSVDLIEKGYLFRTSHEFTLDLTSSGEAITLVLLLVLGLVGSILLTQLRAVRCTPEVAGLISGHAFLAGTFVVFHGDLLPEAWRNISIVPYLLHLSRTTPVLVTLAAVLAVAALEAMFEARNPRGSFLAGLRIVFLVGLIFLFTVYVEWSGLLVVLLVVSCSLVFFRSEPRTLYPAIAALAFLAVVGFASVRAQFGQERTIAVSTQQLFDWATGNTLKEDLFIVPPGLKEFRTYTSRGVFVDFKLFPASTPFLIPEWRRRLELVTMPDKIALRERGWPVVSQLSRTYAQANGPDRIVELLEQTDSDYFVIDELAEEIPPFLPPHARAHSRLEIVFENSRYRVYRLLRKAL